jgi:hypothetical protein
MPAPFIPRQQINQCSLSYAVGRGIRRKHGRSAFVSGFMVCPFLYRVFFT